MILFALCRFRFAGETRLTDLVRATHSTSTESELCATVIVAQVFSNVKSNEGNGKVNVSGRCAHHLFPYCENEDMVQFACCAFGSSPKESQSMDNLHQVKLRDQELRQFVAQTTL